MSEEKEKAINQITEILEQLPAELVAKIKEIMEKHGCTQEALAKIRELLETTY